MEMEIIENFKIKFHFTIFINTYNKRIFFKSPHRVEDGNFFLIVNIKLGLPTFFQNALLMSIYFSIPNSCGFSDFGGSRLKS